MKKKILFPFALTTLLTALSGCGGESANVIPENNNEATTNGTCISGTNNCVEWGLEYPLDGLNFNCSGDKENTFITLFDSKNGVASGTCRNTDNIEFYIQSFGSNKIILGQIKLSDYASFNAQTQLPRLSVIDIASGITGRRVGNLVPSDPTVQVAMRLVKILQALALQKGSIVNPSDVQPLYITEDMRKNLAKIRGNISLTDADLATKIKDFIDISQISDEVAFATVKKLVTIANAAVYQPEFSLFSTSGVIGSNLSGSDGLVGCNKNPCDIQKKDTKYLFGHFMLITDRQGYTFGSGLQWRDTELKMAKENLSSLGGINAQLIRKVKPVQMTADPQSSWINPATKTIRTPYRLNVANTNGPLELYQGRLLNDYVIAGKEAFYKKVTGKTVLDASDQANLGLWRLQADGENYAGSLDLYKIFPISYLDRQVFKTAENVEAGQAYIFPMYANLEFKFTDTTVNPVTLGIVIDSNGDVRTNMQSASNLATDPVAGCQGDVLDSNLLLNGVQQYRLGTLGRAFVADQAVSMRLILANEKFGTLNGALVGVDSRIQSSPDSKDSIVIGGALLNLSNVLNSSAGQTGRVTFLNSVGDTVQWANTYASFQKVYNSNNEDETPADIQLAKLNGGSVEFKLADCYRIKAK
ncbi:MULTISPECIES: hypothetical protein [unclassified Acinetobacter]|uniref:putative pilus system protein FilF n=1 Tax=unclassified Acinetobacter TaxID=196816 RepID=UPI001C216ABE|nr:MULTISPECIES: hypothetical protein [unclassified Acinetobacter]